MKRVRCKLQDFIFLIVFVIFLSTLFFFKTVLILASTPTPSPPSVSDSPDPQKGTSSVTFTCSDCSGSGGEDIKLYICKDSSCTDCRLTMTNSPTPSFTAYGSYSSYATENSPGETVNEDDVRGYINVHDAWSGQDVGGRWTWDFGSSKTGTFKIKWYAKITGDYLSLIHI